ncbi:cell division protein FtsQ/DivIB [Roseateles sp. BYS180W]|uniref:Cell division protein FtsQ n=1 Tax=Roseateles rivi TaxID=3299028 RepID=A0ABW7FRN8_9BURK
MARHNPHTASPALPADIRVMNGMALALLGLLLLMALGAGVLWLARQPMFSIRAIHIEGDVNRNSAASLRANALPRLSGNFLSMNLQVAREAFESVPWVRQAQVQRIWPNQIKVTLQEHQPTALWQGKVDGADASSEAVREALLVNSFGEVFQANVGDVEDEDLPTLSGPQGSAQRMLQMWQALNAISQQRLSEAVTRLDLSGRGSWRLTLEKGGVVELGRGEAAEVQARFQEFASSSKVIAARYHAELVSADLRHELGYALRLSGVSTQLSTQKPLTAKKSN